MNHGIQISRNVQVLGHVLFYVPEAIITQVMLNVFDAPSQQIIEHDYFVILCNHAVTKMRAEETRSSRYQNSHC